ncbi:hypothetical protein [Streptomyces cacaoi]|uniref:hypothetical protein n=1 Tax=Streptomyces cacaoi TaxID=1898 RepID=UPI0011F38D83|nr:hypothetical protein [Streptomyces cacaoi]
MEMHRTETPDGGAEVTLRLTPQEAKALGGDEMELLERLGRGLWAMVDWRTDKPREEWWPVIMDTAKLIRRLEGIRDAAVRDNPRTGHKKLALWLGTPTTTVASRRRTGTLPPLTPTAEEQWARTGDRAVLPRWSSLSRRPTNKCADEY